jgi:hypothetical protein
LRNGQGHLQHAEGGLKTFRKTSTVDTIHVCGVPDVKRKSKAREIPGNDHVARLWRKASRLETSDALVDFNDAIHALLDSRKMTPARFQAIADRIPEDGIFEFMQDVESAASTRALVSVEGGHLLGQIFVIPVLGDLDRIERDIPRREIIDGIARGLRKSGYCQAASNVFLHPGLLPLTALASIDHADLHDILMDGIAFLSGQSSEVPRLNALVMRNRPEPPMTDDVTVGTRFLIGARLATWDEDIDDGLFRTREEADPDLDEDDDREDALQEAWSDVMFLDLPDLDDGISVHPPVAWGDARADLLCLHVWQAISVKLAEEGLDTVDLAPDALSLWLELQGGRGRHRRAFREPQPRRHRNAEDADRSGDGGFRRGSGDADRGDPGRRARGGRVRSSLKRGRPGIFANGTDPAPKPLVLTVMLLMEHGSSAPMIRI